MPTPSQRFYSSEHPGQLNQAPQRRTPRGRGEQSGQKAALVVCVLGYVAQDLTPHNIYVFIYRHIAVLNCRINTKVKAREIIIYNNINLIYKTRKLVDIKTNEKGEINV